MASDDEELRRGLRFAHQLALAAQGEAREIGKEVYTLLEVLVARGVIRLSDLTRRYPAVAERLEADAARAEPRVELGRAVDKYHLDDLPDIDCLARIPLCEARCCSLSFALSAQDLDEGHVRWELDRPYRIRHRADGWCCHIDRPSGRCDVYEHRPAPCRIFDCREDRRIWKDFAARVPADHDDGR